MENNPLAGVDAPKKKSKTVASAEEVYLHVMKKLQFGSYLPFGMIKSLNYSPFNFFLTVICFFFYADSYDMISPAEGGSGYQFKISYHFEKNVRLNGDKNHPSRMKRLAQEAVTLSTSLPLSYSSSVFVRCDTDRLDVMKVSVYFFLHIRVSVYYFIEHTD